MLKIKKAFSFFRLPAKTPSPRRQNASSRRVVPIDLRAPAAQTRSASALAVSQTVLTSQSSSEASSSQAFPSARSVSTPASSKTASTNPSTPSERVSAFEGASAMAGKTPFKIAETSYVFIQKNPETGLAYPTLKTSRKTLEKFRHLGFIRDSNSLTEKLIHGLGQLKKEIFLDQKVNLEGEHTKPAPAFSQRKMNYLSAAQVLLEKLYAFERLINLESPVLAQPSIKKAFDAYQLTMADFSKSTIKEKEKLGLVLAQLDRKLPSLKSLKDFVRSEARNIIQSLEESYRQDTADAGRLLSGKLTRKTTKDALKTIREHEFPLTVTPQSALIPEANTSMKEQVDVPLRFFMENPLDSQAVAQMQRFANYLNLHPDFDGSEIPEERSSTDFSFFNPKKIFESDDIDTPSNQKSLSKKAGVSVAKAAATLGDNLLGVGAGLIQKEASILRQAVKEKLELPIEPPKGSAEHREWEILIQLKPSQTLLNQYSKLAATLLTQILAAIPYAGRELLNPTATWIAEKWDTRKAKTRIETLSQRTINESILAILDKLPTPEELPETKMASGAPVLLPFSIEDTYQSKDLLNAGVKMAKSITSSAGDFAASYPVLAGLSFALMGVIASSSLKDGIQSGINSLQSDIFEPATSQISSEYGKKLVQSLLLNILLKQLKLKKASALSLSSDSLAEFAENTEAFIEKDKASEAFLAQRRSLSNSPSSRLIEEINEVKLSDVEERLLEKFHVLPSLSQKDKDQLCRLFLSLYPDKPELTDLIIHQCQKTGDLSIFGKPLPQSIFSTSIVHAIQYLTKGTGLVRSHVFDSADSPERKLADKKASLHLKESALMLGQTAKQVGSIVAQSARTAAVDFIPGMIDQAARSVSSIAKIGSDSRRAAPSTSPKSITKISARVKTKNKVAQAISKKADQLESATQLKGLQTKYHGNLSLLSALKATKAPATKTTKPGIKRTLTVTVTPKMKLERPISNPSSSPIKFSEEKKKEPLEKDSKLIKPQARRIVQLMGESKVSTPFKQASESRFSRVKTPNPDSGHTPNTP